MEELGGLVQQTFYVLLGNTDTMFYLLSFTFSIGLILILKEIYESSRR